MSKKIFAALIVAVVATFAGYNIYQSQKTEKIVSDLVMANVEALAGDTEGGATITCSRTCSDGVGRCYKVYDDWGNCHFDGSQIYSCTCYLLRRSYTKSLEFLYFPF